MGQSNRSIAFAVMCGTVLTVLAAWGAVGGSEAASSSAVTATLKKLKITFETSHEEKAGTNSDIYVAISYKTPSEAGGQVFLVPTTRHDLEKGETNSYALTIPPGSRLDGKEIDQISAITVFNLMTGSKPGWHVSSVEIRALGSDGATYTLASGAVGRWLDSKEAEGPVLCVPLKVPAAYLGAGDSVGNTTEWKTMK